jgi:integrase
MPRRSSALNVRLDEYAVQLRKRKRREQTITEYRRIISHAFGALEAADLECTPKRIGEEEVYFLHNEVYGRLEPLTARNQLAVFGTFLKRVGNNPVVENMRIEWPQDLRIHAKWLEPHQAKMLKDAAFGMERILVHLELDCLMRRCEVMRLRMQDFRGSHIDILGKGRAGGKPRSIPYHPKTSLELSYLDEVREVLIGRAQRRTPIVTVPDAVVIWEKFGRLGSCKETSIDRMLKTVAERAELPLDSVSNHVLRRTGARILKRGGTPTTTIMRILGHSREEDTIKYLGLNLDDMKAGMELGDRFMESLEKGTMRYQPAV